MLRDEDECGILIRRPNKFKIAAVQNHVIQHINIKLDRKVILDKFFQKKKNTLKIIFMN